MAELNYVIYSLFKMPEEPVSVTKTLTQEQIEEVRKEASSALHGDTMAYETSKYCNMSILNKINGLLIKEAYDENKNIILSYC